MVPAARIWVGVFAASALAACATRPPPPPPPSPPPEPILYEWWGDTIAGPVSSIRISLSRQRADIFIGGKHAGWMTVATGKPGHATPVGRFPVMEKIVEKYSSHYGRLLDADGNVVDEDADARRDCPPPGGRFDPAPMYYWMRLTRYGIGMHAGYIPEPGRPASKGCIRMPKPFAPILFARVALGTPVQILH